MDYSNKELREFYFDNLIKYFKKDWRVAFVVVNPFINEKIFKDIELVGQSKIALELNDYLIKNCFVPTGKDLFDNPILASTCVFSKEIEGMDKEGLYSSISSKGRQNINKVKKSGVLVRDINLESSDDRAIFDFIMEDTSKRLKVDMILSDRFVRFKKGFKDKLHLKLAYIDCDNFIENANDELRTLKKEYKELEPKLLEENSKLKKVQNKAKELERHIQTWEERIDKIIELKSVEGNIINLSAASFFESGQDLIYFSSGNLPKFATFDL